MYSFESLDTFVEQRLFLRVLFKLGLRDGLCTTDFEDKAVVAGFELLDLNLGVFKFLLELLDVVGLLLDKTQRFLKLRSGCLLSFGVSGLAGRG